MLIMWGDKILIGLIMVIISQCISKHQVVHLKYTQFILVNYTSIKLRKEGEIRTLLNLKRLRKAEASRCTLRIY